MFSTCYQFLEHLYLDHFHFQWVNFRPSELDPFYFLDTIRTGKFVAFREEIFNWVLFNNILRSLRRIVEIFTLPESWQSRVSIKILATSIWLCFDLDYFYEPREYYPLDISSWYITFLIFSLQVPYITYVLTFFLSIEIPAFEFVNFWSLFLPQSQQKQWRFFSGLKSSFWYLEFPKSYRQNSCICWS